MPLRPLNECYTFPLFSFSFGENEATCLLPKTHTPWLYCCKICLLPLSSHPSPPASPNFLQAVSSKVILHLLRCGVGGDSLRWLSWRTASPNTASAQEVPNSPDLLCLPKNKNKKKSLNLNISLAHAWECLPVPWQFHEVVHGWQKKAQVGILRFLLLPNMKTLAWRPPGLVKEDPAAQFVNAVICGHEYTWGFAERCKYRLHTTMTPGE